MKTVIDDLPVVMVSRLRAAGVIGRDTKTTTLRFDDSGVEFVVEVTSKKFPRCGGDWSMFRCHCGRRSQKIRLFEGRPTCAHCIRSTGMRYRTEMVSHASKRTALTAPKRIERLTSIEPACACPRPGRRLDRRANIELALKRSLIVERRAKIAQFEKGSGEPMITPGGKAAIPDTVKHLDPDIVVEVLSRHGVNVSDAASELGVASADLRRLLWARPHLTDMAVEMVERRLDLAEKNIYEALNSDDSRRRDAASMFVIRNSHKARRRGWITSSTSAAELSVSVGDQRQIVYTWRSNDPDKRAEEQAKIERLQAEGKRVVSFSWGGSTDDESKLIEHKAKPPDKD
jgi:hypothetical protein